MLLWMYEHCDVCCSGAGKARRLLTVRVPEPFLMARSVRDCLVISINYAAQFWDFTWHFEETYNLLSYMYWTYGICTHLTECLLKHCTILYMRANSGWIGNCWFITFTNKFFTFVLLQHPKYSKWDTSEAWYGHCIFPRLIIFFVGGGKVLW